MAQLKEMLQWQTVLGDRVVVGDVSITPQSQALVIRAPFGGLVWNRPVAILVQRGEQADRIPIVDVTRVAQLILLSISLAFSILALLARRRREPDER